MYGHCLTCSLLHMCYTCSIYMQYISCTHVLFMVRACFCQRTYCIAAIGCLSCVPFNLRHPEGSCRPTFSEILDALLHPENELLHWKARDQDVHPEASKLGAPLRAGEQLYPELQNTYMSTYETASSSLK